MRMHHWFVIPTIVLLATYLAHSTIRLKSRKPSLV